MQVNYQEILDNLDHVIEDWVIIEKVSELDGAKKIGLIIIPDTINTNIRESKIGIIRASGSGSVANSGRFTPSDLDIGRYCYYTRYGKESFTDSEGKTWIVTRQRGILAYIHLVDNFVQQVIPRNDRLFVKEIEDAEKLYKSLIIIPNTKKKFKDYRRYKVLATGPGVLVRPKIKSEADLKTIKASYEKGEAKAGDVIISSAGNGVQISWINNDAEREIYRLVSENECIAIYNGSQNVE